MKNAFLKILVVTLFFQFSGFSNSANASRVSMQSMESLLDLNTLSDSQYNDITDILEAGEADSTPQSERVLTAEEQALVSDQSVNEKSALLNLPNLQKYSEKQVVGYGQWGFHFIFIDKNGVRHEMTSYKQSHVIRPASTLKLFSADIAFDNKTESLANLKELLYRSVNGMADQALRKTALASSYELPSQSYLNDPLLLNYKMWDALENKDQVIDLPILRGCGMMISKYSELEDGDKFRPVNGSGLQMTGVDTPIQTNSVTPRFVTALLEKIHNDQTKYKVYKTLLSTPGATRIVKGRVSRFGSLSAHFVQGRNYGKIYAKTGTLGNGKGLAGFAETKNGTLIFSILSDDLKAINRSQAFSGPIEKIVTTHLKFVNK